MNGFHSINILVSDRVGLYDLFTYSSKGLWNSFLWMVCGINSTCLWSCLACLYIYLHIITCMWAKWIFFYLFTWQTRPDLSKLIFSITILHVKAPTAPFIAPVILNCPDFRESYLSLHSQHLAKYLIYNKWSVNAAFTAFWSATIKTRVLSWISSTENGITWLHTIARQLSRAWDTVDAVKQEGATANLRSKSQI